MSNSKDKKYNKKDPGIQECHEHQEVSMTMSCSPDDDGKMKSERLNRGLIIRSSYKEIYQSNPFFVTVNYIQQQKTLMDKGNSEQSSSNSADFGQSFSRIIPDSAVVI